MTTMPPTTPLAVLIAALRNAKEVEAQANLHRLAIEKQIVARYPQKAGYEGTVKEPDFSLTFKVTRSIDTEGLQAAWSSLSENAQKAFTWKAGLDTKKYRAIADLDPKGFAQVANFVTTKEAKPTILLSKE